MRLMRPDRIGPRGPYVHLSIPLMIKDLKLNKRRRRFLARTHPIPGLGVRLEGSCRVPPHGMEDVSLSDQHGIRNIPVIGIR